MDKEKRGFGRNGWLSLIMWNVILFAMGYMGGGNASDAAMFLIGGWFGVGLWYILDVDKWLFPRISKG